MAILNQKRILNLIPKTSAPVTIHVSQGDVGTEIEFTLVKGDELFVNTGSLSASVHGVREDGANFGVFTCTLSGSSVKFPLHAEMTAVKGSAIAEIVLVDSQGNKVGSSNFGIMVEESVFPLGVTYDNDVSVYESILAYVQTIPAQITSDYNTKINALNTTLANEITARQNADNTEANTRAAADTTLGARIDNIVAPSGEAPSAAEVTDARVGANGLTYSSLGTAIRTQIDDVYEEIDSQNVLYDSKNLYEPSKNSKVGVYAGYSDGRVNSNSEYTAIGIKISSGRPISINVGDGQYAFFSYYSDIANLSVGDFIPGYISGGYAGGTTSKIENISVPNNAEMIVISFRTSNITYLQVEYGESCTPYEPYSRYIDGGIIADESITEQQLANDVLKKTTGKNLFNKNSSNKIIGFYVNYNSGYVAPYDDYSSIALPIKGGEKVSTNKTSLQISFYERYSDISGLASRGNIIPGYISGITQSSVITNASVPENAKMMVVSFANNFIDSLQVEYGATNTSYESYVSGYDGSLILPNSIPKNRIDNNSAIEIELKADGTGDYANLRLCIEAINAMPTSRDTVRILLNPGTYDIRACYTQTEWDAENFIGLTIPHDVSIVGINGSKEDIVITCTSETQKGLISTLNLTYNIVLENLTIYGENIRYTIHDDYAPYNIGNKKGVFLKANEVDFIGSILSYAFVYGAGTAGGAKKEYHNCRFINLTDGECYSNHDKYVQDNTSFSTLSETHYYENCEFIGKRNRENVRICPANSGVNQTYIFIGCKMDSLKVSSQFTGGNDATTVPDILGTGNSDDIVYIFYCDHDRLSKPRFTDKTKAGINTSGGILTSGSYVKFGDYGIIEGTSDDNVGVLILDSNSGGVAYYQ